MAADENLEKGRRKSGFCLTLVNNRVHPCGKTGGRDVISPLLIFLGDVCGRGGGGGGGKGSTIILKHRAILYNEAEVFSLSIKNPNGQPMLPCDWLIQSSLILASCNKISAVEK